MRRVWHDSLYRNTLSLLLNGAVFSLSGFVFWAVAARLYAGSVVGVLGSVVAGSSFASVLAYVGFDFALVRFLPASPDPAGEAHAGLTVTGGASIVAAVGYATVVGVTVSRLGFLLASPTWLLLFVLLCLMTVWNLMTNVVFVAYRVAHLALASTLVFATARLALVFAMPGRTELSLLLAWLGALIVSVAFSFFALARWVGYRFRPRISPRRVRHVARYAGGNYLASLIQAAPTYLLPVIVLGLAGPRTAAVFFIVYLVATATNMILTSAGQSLLAESSASGHIGRESVRKAAHTVAALLVPSILGLMVVGRPLLDLLGHRYASQGYPVLLLLCVASLIRPVGYLSMTALRFWQRLAPVVVSATAGSAVALAGVVVAWRAGGGLAGAGGALVVAEATTALFALAGARRYGTAPTRQVAP